MGAFALGPSLALRLRRSRAGFDFAGDVLPPGASLTRASPAARVRGDGLIVIESANVARFDHDPVTHRPLGLLIEGAASNVMVRSHALADAAWVRSGVALASAGAPDGSGDAVVVTDATSSYGSIAQTVSLAGPVVLSIHVAKDAVTAATRFPVLRLAPGGDLRIDTATGAILGTTTGGAIDIGSYWRCWLTTTASPTEVQIFPAAGSGAIDAGYSAEVTGGIGLWGAQLELGDRPTSIIRTHDGAATRAADIVTLDWGGRGLADGVAAIRYLFDDESSAIVATTIAGGQAPVPTTLPRRHLRAAEPA